MKTAVRARRAMTSGPRLVAALMALLLCVPAASAQWIEHPDPRTPRLVDGQPDLRAPAPRRPDGTPDLGGIWNAIDGRFLTNLANRAGIEVPFRASGAATFTHRQETLGRDRPSGFCLPKTIPSAMLVPGYPWKVVQTPGLLVVLFENFTQYRQIFLDDRDFPADQQPTWFGYSVGHWDGDALVVETVGFNDKGWLDDAGHPRTERMRTIERIRRPDFGSLEIEFTFDDSGAYTEPWSVTVPFELLPDTDIIENVCENEKDIGRIFSLDP